MNRDYVLYNLREAHEAVGQIIRDIERDSDYAYGEFVVDLSHVYHHINTAWNAQDATEAQVEACTEGDYRRWRRLPKQDDLLLEP